jgi:hypothetical protein
MFLVIHKKNAHPLGCAFHYLHSIQLLSVMRMQLLNINSVHHFLTLNL